MNRKERKLQEERDFAESLKRNKEVFEERRYIKFVVFAKCRNCGKEFEADKISALTLGFLAMKADEITALEKLPNIFFHKECNGVADIIRIEKRIGDE